MIPNKEGGLSSCIASSEKVKSVFCLEEITLCVPVGGPLV